MKDDAQDKKRVYLTDAQIQILKRQLLFAAIVGSPVFVILLLVWANSAWMLAQSFTNNAGANWVFLSGIMTVGNFLCLIFGLKRLERRVDEIVSTQRYGRELWLPLLLAFLVYTLVNVAILVVFDPPYNQISVPSFQDRVIYGF
jgi:hypothetical protein